VTLADGSTASDALLVPFEVTGVMPLVVVATSFAVQGERVCVCDRCVSALAQRDCVLCALLCVCVWCSHRRHDGMDGGPGVSGGVGRCGLRVCGCRGRPPGSDLHVGIIDGHAAGRGGRPVRGGVSRAGADVPVVRSRGHTATRAVSGVVVGGEVVGPLLAAVRRVGGAA
jgi:hypothetical protein